MQRKIILSILSILILLCTVSLIYEKINKDKTNTGMFAIYLEKEKDTGNYKKSNLKTWPTEEEYAINMQKTYCENGSILRWNLETKKINVTVKGTDKCYVYFDKAEYGTEQHPHLIQTIEDLVRLSNDVNSGITYAGEYFLLTNDLDFQDPSDYEDSQRLDFLDINGINGNEALITELTTGSGFNPIGSSETNSFQGVFDGNNKEIENIFVSVSNPDRHAALFAYVKNTEIKNLTVSGAIENMYSGGGLVSDSYGASKIIDCHNKVNVTGINQTGSLAGIVGLNDGTLEIKDCSNEGEIKNSNDLGGIVGWNNNNLVIANTVNYGNISNNFGVQAGGLIGIVTTTSTTKIENSHNDGAIIHNTDMDARVGGLIGEGRGKIIINKSFNAGNIIGSSNKTMARQGGIIGFFSYSSLIILNSYNKGNISNDIIDAKYTNSNGICVVNDNTHTYIINSYNAGDVIMPNDKVENYAAGIYMGGVAQINKSLLLNNVFNVGKLDAKWTFAIGWIPPQMTYDVKNTYYLEGLQGNIAGLNIDKAMSASSINSQEFVDTLNENIESINLSEIDESLKDYTLSKWKLGSDGYPTLDF